MPRQDFRQASRLGASGARIGSACPTDLLETVMKRSPLVLIVDDVTDNREGYAQYLQFRGFRTAEAETGQDALTEANRCRPDVILLDMRLPVIDGLEVTRRLRAGGFAETPIIAVSASVAESDIAAALDSGCDAFLAKPCLPEAVVDEINRQLNRRTPRS
jgi:CheY-like chemotaxis protein